MLDSLLLSLWMIAAAGSSGQTPFWAQANTGGLMPAANGGLVCAALETGYQEAGAFQWRAGTTLAARAAVGEGAGAQVNEAYAGLRWRAFALDLGMKQHTAGFVTDRSLGSLSVTGGNVAWSNNARPMPGYTLTLDPVPIPLTRGKVLLEGAFGDYKTLDDRFVQGALVHNTRFYFIFPFTSRLEFRFGLDHYAMWGGRSSDPAAVNIPVTFSNYLRVITGQNASSAGSESDQINVIGNQLGGELFRLAWRGDGWRVAIQHDIPYDDGSGMGFQNFPDGVNTLWFSWDDKDRWISDILFEYHYTKWQSGPDHDGVVNGEWVILGGHDNYFNNQEYLSGWTHFGRTIGDPLLYPCSDAPGIANNRLSAHHFALAGKLFRKAPYKLMLTHSANLGTYDDPLRADGSALHQFSCALQGLVPGLFRQPWLTLAYGVYGDWGEVLPRSVGATLGLRFNFYY